jgi:membrane protein DedA with SNARE-associated domain
MGNPSVARTSSTVGRSHGYCAIALILGFGLALPAETILLLAAMYAAADLAFDISFVIAAAWLS